MGEITYLVCDECGRWREKGPESWRTCKFCHEVIIEHTVNNHGREENEILYYFCCEMCYKKYAAKVGGIQQPKETRLKHDLRLEAVIQMAWKYGMAYAHSFEKKDYLDYYQRVERARLFTWWFTCKTVLELLTGKSFSDLDKKMWVEFSDVIEQKQRREREEEVTKTNV